MLERSEASKRTGKEILPFRQDDKQTGWQQQVLVMLERSEASKRTGKEILPFRQDDKYEG